MMRSKKYIPTQNRILGIDPGYGRLGLAIVDSVSRDPELIKSDCFETSAALAYEDRLSLVVQKVQDIIKTYKPEVLALETLIFSKNKKTALKVAEVRGAIISLCASSGLELQEFHPNNIKLAVTGHGHADKKQIETMINIMFRPKDRIKYDDEYDAIAVALTSAVSTGAI